MAANKQASGPDAATLARRNEYATKFFPFVEKVARRLARRLPAHVDLDDLVSAGVIGLMDAAAHFDPGRVDRFETFAEFRIRGAMLDDVRSRDTLSRDMRRLSNGLRDAARHLEIELGRAPDHGEIAAHLGLELEALYARQGKLSGASVVGIDDAGPDLLERTPDTLAEDPLEAAERRELLGHLAAALAKLPARHALVLLRYCVREELLTEIAADLGVTDSRVCQIVKEAIGMMPTDLRRFLAD